MKHWITLFLILSSILCGCSATESKQTSPETITAPKATTQATEMHEEVEKPTESTLISYESGASLVEAYLADKISGVSAHAEGSTIVVDICTTGIVDASKKAIAGEQAFAEKWDQLVESQISLCTALQDTYLPAIGLTDASVMINILNDKNPDNALLIIMSGDVIYDIVNTH